MPEPMREPMSHCSEDEVEVLEHVSIPMADGCRLAGRVWLPPGARGRPVPAILEYIPYRLDDFRAVRDDQHQRWFAMHGYAAIRVDLRGSGSSEGVLQDEYLQQELDDGVTVLRWLAEQPWCNGRVGMIGISWGGFNALQLAALQPPELHAVITVCSSDDRYADDVHYMGGCLLTDNLSWASVMASYNACPPDPAVVGDAWRDLWRQRLEDSGLWLRQWLRHQRRDAYWRHASVCEDFGAIRCPVFAVSGWADGYCNTVFRLMRHLDVPRRGLVGPWNHKYPHLGGPGPAIDFLGECLTWWDRWLADVDNGADREPRIRAWMQDSVSPHSDDRPGHWVAEPDWPADGIPWAPWGLAPGRLDPDPETRSPAALSVQSPLSVGLFAGKWCSYSESTDLPTDQRLEDGGSLVFDSNALEHDIEILGAPYVELDIEADQPQAMVAVRISDVAPDGKATLVTYGLLNLSHRDSHAEPEPIEPGRRYRVRVPLNYVGQRFPAGNRLRLAVSSSYWPLAWPAPEPVRLTVHTATSTLHLPRREPRSGDAELRDLGEPRMAAPLPTTVLGAARREWRVLFNLATNEAVLEVVDDDAPYRLDTTGTRLGNEVTERYSCANDDYGTLYGEVHNRRTFDRGDWHVTTTTRTVLTATPETFRLRATLDAWEGDTRVFSAELDDEIPRDAL